MAEEFKFKISVDGADAAAAGTGKVADSLGKVGAAAKQSGESARTLTEDLTSLGSRQNATKDVVEGLDSALKGNANSMFGVAKAAKNLWEIFTVSTPAGRALQFAMIAVATAAQVMGKKIEEAAKPAETTAEELDAMREAAEAFNKVRFDNLNAQLDALKAKGDSTLGFFKRLADLSKQLDDASMALEIARLNADDSLSPEARKAGELRIRDRYGREALKRDAGLRDTELTELRNTAAGTRGAASAAEAQRALDAFLVGGIEGNRTRLTQQADALLTDYTQRSQALGRNQAGQLALSDEFHGARKSLLAEADIFFNPKAEEQLKIYKDRLKASTADAEAKAKLAAEAERKLAAAERISPFEERTASQLADLASRERNTAAGIADRQRRPLEAEPTATPQTVIIDLASVRTIAQEQGKTTGQIIAEMYRQAMEANNEAIIREVRETNKAIQRQ